MKTTVEKVTARIVERSRGSRSRYLKCLDEARIDGPFRHRLPCSNLAHSMAAGGEGEKGLLKDGTAPNIAVISGYNDMLSAHQPFERYPAIIKEALAGAGGVAQFAGGVPAICDGVVQGEPGMDLSLISRDVIAMSTVLALSHGVFDGALLLGICDKVLPGLLMGALQFGHLPAILVPGGPMTSGLPNKEKARARELFAEEKITRAEMLEVECRAYHDAGTCTFYGTANSNQLMAEMLGLHLPGSSFVNAGTGLRDALTREAAVRVASLTDLQEGFTPVGRVVSEKSVVNAMVGLLATGGSTNETLHLVAVAKAAGIVVNWDDFSDLSDAVPLMVRIYPNGPEDINAFQSAGGMALLVNELLQGGCLHDDVQTVAGPGLERYTLQPVLESGRAVWREAPEESGDAAVIASMDAPFSLVGGIKVLSGNLGRAVLKVSALSEGVGTVVEAPAAVFDSQGALENAFHEGWLDRDLMAVVRFQGPRANGMPELHKLITYLSILMERGHTVGLVTDGRLSGASGKVPSAIHVTPEALCGGLLAKVRDGDIVRIDARTGRLELKVERTEIEAREPVRPDLTSLRHGHGRRIFNSLRDDLEGAEEGASSLFTCHPGEEV